MGADECTFYRTYGDGNMTSEQIFKNAEWIECTGSDSPVFRKTFTAKKGEDAEIIICGLGFFKLFINGRKVSDDLLVPNTTCYNERNLHELTFPLDDELSYRTYCMKYDISDYLAEGENRLEVILGNGYYNQNYRMAEGNVVFGTPKLCYIIEKASGNVISDETTLAHKGFVTFNNLYYGEKQDYTLYPVTDEGFAESTVIPAPESEYYIQFSPADKVIRTLKPVLIEDEGETKLYDIGENTVGYAVFKCAEKGRKFRVSYAEEIHENRDWYGIQFNFDKDYQTDEFIADGTDREYIPHFTWHGFRYFRVTADVEPLRVDVVHSDCPVTSSFECNNEILNWLYDAYIRTQLGNMHCGIPSDCPHRERLGYTGDGQLCGETAMMLLDSREFYRKWLYDIADCQCRKTGHVQHTAPLMGGGGGPSGWGGAIIEVPYKFYKMYGDKELLNEFFPKMLHFLDYLESRSENGLVCREEKDGWCLGDWCTPDPIVVPETYINTVLYVRFIQQVIEAARILGREDEISHLYDRDTKIRKALDIAYFSPWSHSYCGDVNGASCLAFRVGMGDEQGKKNMVRKYEELKMFDTGIIATEALIGYLFEINENQLAFDLLSNENKASFAFMKNSGATTIWENWYGRDSRNHPMFGAVTKYLFMYLLGIRQPEGGAAYESVIINPRFVEGLDRAKGHITTENGKISVEYEKSGSTATVKVFADPKIKAVFEHNGEKIPFSGEREFTVEV